MLKLSEVAERLNCSLANVYALRDAGLLHCVATGAHGKGLRVEESELERFVADRRDGRRIQAPAYPPNCKPIKLKHLR